jgi:hypothetical protein
VKVPRYRQVAGARVVLHVLLPGAQLAVRCSERKGLCLKRGHRRARGLTHFVAALLPKAPTSALKLDNRTPLTVTLRALLVGYRRTRSTTAAAPLDPCRGGAPLAGRF